VGKWLARLAALDDAGEDKNSAPSFPPHCQNRQNPVLSALAVRREGGAGEICLEREAAAAPPHPHGRGWSDADIARFHTRSARLLRWGWPADVAEALADRLTCRDVAGHDDRVSCADCRHYRPGRCGNHRHAGLPSAELGRDLAGMLQRCSGFQLEG
jgi:hypothetical protein